VCPLFVVYGSDSPVADLHLYVVDESKSPIRTRIRGGTPASSSALSIAFRDALGDAF
jgi:hypothetical protein